MASLPRVNGRVGTRCNPCSFHKLSRSSRTVTRPGILADGVERKIERENLRRLRCLGDPSDEAEVASSISEQCIASLLANDVDGLMEFIPDDVCETCLEEKKKTTGGWQTAESLAFDDVVYFQKEGNPGSEGNFKIDSFAARLLSTDVLTKIEVLSSMLLDGSRFMQRWSVTGSCGEEVILTVTFALQDTVMPAYRGVHVSKCWMLEEIKGEAPEVELEMPTPDTRWPPELIVKWQLDALRKGNVHGVFNFASPKIKSTFPSVADFGIMLHSDIYSPLLFHDDHKILSSKTVDGGAFVQCVSVRCPGSKKWDTFAWLVCRETTGEFADCWMTSGVLHQHSDGSFCELE